MSVALARQLASCGAYRWPIGSAVLVNGSPDRFRIVGHVERRHRHGAQLRLRSPRAAIELTISVGDCTPYLEDAATAALLLAALWELDSAWHTHQMADGYAAHIDPDIAEWRGATLGEAIALALVSVATCKTPAGT